MIRDVSWSESRASTYSAWRSTENACTTRQQLPLNQHTKMCKLHHGCVVCWCTIRYDQYDVAAAPQSVPMVLRRSLLLPFTEFMNSCVIGPSRDYLGTSRRLPSCPKGPLCRHLRWRRRDWLRNGCNASRISERPVHPYKAYEFWYIQRCFFGLRKYKKVIQESKKYIILLLIENHYLSRRCSCLNLTMTLRLKHRRPHWCWLSTHLQKRMLVW